LGVDDVVVDDVCLPRKSAGDTVELNHKFRVAEASWSTAKGARHIAEDCAGGDGTGGSRIGLLCEDQ
jgi:hypothetical protein